MQKLTTRNGSAGNNMHRRFTRLVARVAAVLSLPGHNAVAAALPVTSRRVLNPLLGLVSMVALFSYALPASAAYTNVIVFGDSLSDTGKVYSASYGFYPRSPYWNGRFSNGKVGVEYLATEIGAPLTDYAYGGATSGTGNYITTLTGFVLPGISQQVSSYLTSLSGGPADSQALFVLWAGANDFLTYNYNQPLYYPGGSSQLITSTVDNLKDRLVSLETAGARNILVPSLPEVLPGSGLAAPYAQALETMLTGLEGTAGFDAKLYRLDVLGLYGAILSSPAGYGFTSLSPCYNESSGALCSKDLAVQNQTPFWDQLGHPTTAAHAILGHAMAQAVVVPLPAAAWLFGSGLLGLIGVARRKRRQLM